MLIPRKSPSNKKLPTEVIKEFKCSCCENSTAAPSKLFYMSKYSELYDDNEKYVPICKDCLSKLFDKMSRRTGSDKMALLVCCHYLDVIYSEDLFDTVSSNQSFSLGAYLRLLNGSQYKNRNFASSLLNGSLVKTQTPDQAREQREVRWSESDIRNRERIKKILKYDPFEEYAEADRKLMFNLCSDYLVDESTIEDPHKLQGVVEIVKTLQQINVIDSQINNETKNATVNEQRFRTLSTIKKDLLESINKFAKDNGISATLSAKGLKGSSSLAYHVKKLDEMDFTASEINLFDIATCESMSQFAEISNQAILKTIRLNSDELGDMLEEQTRSIMRLQADLASLKEENRKLKIQLKEASSSGFEVG